MMIINLKNLLHRILPKTYLLAAANTSASRVKTIYIIKRNFSTSESHLVKKTNPLNFQRPERKTTINPKLIKLSNYILIIEVVILIATYLIWKRMNTSQEFRFYMSKNHPIILEGKFKDKMFELSTIEN
jgi:hypothetical protein